MTLEFNHVGGEDRGKVILYALSTCGWCARTKKLLNELAVDYSYVDVDLLDKDGREVAIEEIRQWNPRCSFPTMVIRDAVCVTGFDEDKIREELDHG